MADIDFSPRVMTGASAPTPFVASASSEFGGQPAYGSFNGSSFWRSNAAPTQYLEIDLGANNGQVLSSYSITSADSAARSPKDWTMQGSNDGSSFSTLDTVTSQTSWSVPETRTFTVTGNTTVYRYYKLNITANNGDANFVAVGQLKLLLTAPSDSAPHNMTSNSLPTPYVASASAEFSAGFAAWKAFDGTTTTGNAWAGTTTSGILEMDLGSGASRVLTSYLIVFADSSRLRGPKDWTMQGSANGSAWTTVDTQTSQASWGIVRSYTVTPAAGYRYFRLNISAIQTSGDIPSITELYLVTTAAGGVGGLAGNPGMDGGMMFPELKGGMNG